MDADLRHMRHFVAVAEELHFGRAAARLGMAQPPLSQSIRRLEGALGFPLLERTRRRVGLTPAGQVFLEEARSTLRRADEAVRIARRAASEDMAELTVTFVSAALYRTLPEVLRSHREGFPAAAIRLDERPTEAQLAGLQDGSVDIDFVTPPVAAGMGVSLVPDGARTMRVDGVRFVALTGAPDDLTWDLAMAWKPRGASRALASLIRTVRSRVDPNLGS
jgi:DNA-binding transcriptional LysR family regulator